MATVTNTELAKRVLQTLGQLQESQDPDAHQNDVVQDVIGEELAALRKKNIATWADDATPDYILGPYVVYLAWRVFPRLGGTPPQTKQEIQALMEMRSLTARSNVSGSEITAEYF